MSLKSRVVASLDDMRWKPRCSGDEEMMSENDGSSVMSVLNSINDEAAEEVSI